MVAHSTDTQVSKPIAVIDGKELIAAPDDLYIPPDALEIWLDTFTGPLDLLLYLIRKQNIDILNIPITSITLQYLQYIQWMENKNLELAAEYLLMAALLAEIKSRMLLPVPPSTTDEEEEDPRLVLVRRLQAYEQIKMASEILDSLPRQERDIFNVCVSTESLGTLPIFPHVELSDMLLAMRSVFEKKQCFGHHEIAREFLSVRQRMAGILLQIQGNNLVEFYALYEKEEGRMGLVVSFLAILELAKQSLISITQVQPFSPIYIRSALDG